jgi:predicted ATP-dependent endonuclease of OLD family
VACKEILGFVVTAVPALNGSEPGVFVDSDATIPLDAMGEGVPNIVGLLADLALAQGKLFLIEELENDLHPVALKALLRLILSSAENDQNQFVVSTHSNIVVRYLASAPDSKLFYVTSEGQLLPPQATVREIGADPNERMAVLRELGYELNDFNLWDGWIFLEESSAERIIRDHLIPWFAPGLVQRVRTLSADGNTNVEPAFEDFHRLVRFTHLEPAYRGRAWVVIDGDEPGHEIIAGLRERYGATWDASRFRTLRERDFEGYYPDRFAEDRDAALAEQDRQTRRAKKRQLLERVRAWIAENPEQAKAEFETSAAEVIEVLRAIEVALFGTSSPP